MIALRETTHGSVNKVGSKTMKTRMMGVCKATLVLALLASCCDFIVATDGRDLEARQGIGDWGLSIRHRPDSPGKVRELRTSTVEIDARERTIRRKRNVNHASTDDVRRKPKRHPKPGKAQRRKVNKALKKRKALKRRRRKRARKRAKQRKLRRKRRRIKKRKAKKKRRSRKKHESTRKSGSFEPREPKPSPPNAIEPSPEPFESPVPSPAASEKPVASSDSSARRGVQEENSGGGGGAESETGVSLQADIDTESPLKVQVKPFGASAGAGGRGPRRVCYKIYVLQGTTIRHYRVKFRTAVPDKGRINVKVIVGGCIARAYRSQCIKLTSLKKKSCSDAVVKQCLGKKISLFEETSPDDGEKDGSSKPKLKAKSDPVDPPLAKT